MIKISKADQDSILQRIRDGRVDAASLSTSSLVDDIILSMHKHGVIGCLKRGFPDKRADNTTVPFDLMLALAIAAKMKVHTSLTDIPFALTDHRTICELGYSMWDSDKDIGSGLMNEGTIRHLVRKYTSDELIRSYNSTLQEHIMDTLSIKSNIHILDCTKLEVNMKNNHYENATVGRDSDGDVAKGYKLSTIRGIVGDRGIIEDIRFGTMSTHDLALSQSMLYETPVFTDGDILINDKGFLSRDTLNFLKTHRGVDTYIPIRKNMEAYEIAVAVAQKANKWKPHPTQRRTSQSISFVAGLSPYWRSKHTEDDVDINACVVWDREDDKYFVFVTTDTTKSASQIIKTYELRPEIEEDYRQLKDFWNIEDFKSTKLTNISFRIVCVLLGYLFFQLYTMLPDGEQFAGKSLPVIMKNYKSNASHHLVIYSDEIFGVLTIAQMAEVYAQCDKTVRRLISAILENV